MSGLFVLGAVQPVEASSSEYKYLQCFINASIEAAQLTLLIFSSQYGIKKIKHMPYNHQHQYFFLCMDA